MQIRAIFSVSLVVNLALTIASALAGDNQDGAVQLFFELEELSRLMAISYCVGNQGIREPFECLNHCDEFRGFELLATWNNGFLDSTSCGYVALSHSPHPPRIVVAFRGSNSISDTVYDLMTRPAEYSPYPDEPLPPPPGDDTVLASYRRPCLGCKVHAGFMTAWNDTRAQVLPVLSRARSRYPDYRLVLTGHSLGGAVAGLAGLEMRARGWDLDVTTFGEPRFGNAELAEFTDWMFEGEANSYRRVTHQGDPVPLLPPDNWGWMPHSGEIFIAKDGLPPEVEDLVVCDGPRDPKCIVGHEPEEVAAAKRMLNVEARVARTVGGWSFLKKGLGIIPGFPAEWKLWQILFAHREYFWRVGLCWDPQWREYPKPSEPPSEEL